MFIPSSPLASFTDEQARCESAGGIVAQIDSNNIGTVSSNLPSPAFIGSWNGDSYNQSNCLVMTGHGSITSSDCDTGFPILCEIALSSGVSLAPQNTMTTSNSTSMMTSLSSTAPQPTGFPDTLLTINKNQFVLIAPLTNAVTRSNMKVACAKYKARLSDIDFATIETIAAKLSSTTFVGSWNTKHYGDQCLVLTTQAAMSLQPCGLNYPILCEILG